MSREEFHVTIYVEIARVLPSNLTMFRPYEWFWEVLCDCRESHLLCDLPKVLTDKSQVCAVELVLLEYFVSSIKTLRECLV